MSKPGDAPALAALLALHLVFPLTLPMPDPAAAFAGLGTRFAEHVVDHKTGSGLMEEKIALVEKCH